MTRVLDLYCNILQYTVLHYTVILQLLELYLCTYLLFSLQLHVDLLPDSIDYILWHWSPLNECPGDSGKYYLKQQPVRTASL